MPASKKHVPTHSGDRRSWQDEPEALKYVGNPLKFRCRPGRALFVPRRLSKYCSLASDPTPKPSRGGGAVECLEQCRISSRQQQDPKKPRLPISEEPEVPCGGGGRGGEPATCSEPSRNLKGHPHDCALTSSRKRELLLGYVPGWLGRHSKPPSSIKGCSKRGLKN